MTQSRTKSMELRAIREQAQESPPPPPAGATVREWFAGLALMNPVLMHGFQPTERATEAVRLADELIKALVVPRTPSQETLTVPQDEHELQRSWDSLGRAMNSTPEQKECAAKATAVVRPVDRITSPDQPAARRQTLSYGATIPPPALHFKRASDMLMKAAQRAGLPFPSTHSSLHPDPEEK